MQLEPLGSGTAKYRSVLGSIATIFKEEGLVGLWRGWAPTCARAAALSGAQLASYDHSKVLLLRWGAFEQEGKGLHFLCAMFSGVVAATACNPPDVLKSRMMLSSAAGGADVGW